MSVADWLKLWLASTKIEVSPKTHERYAEIVRCYLIPGLGTIGLQRLAPSDITRAYASFERKPSPRTRRHIHRILKSALARAVEQQALTRNPADALKRLPKAGLRFKSTKSEKGRGVALPSFAVTELRSHKQAQAQTLLALGVRQSGDTLVLREG
jgi:plasmid stabilization system protein ParE